MTQETLEGWVHSAIEERTLVKAEMVLEILIKMHLGDQTCTLFSALRSRCISNDLKP